MSKAGLASEIMVLGPGDGLFGDVCIFTYPVFSSP